ncbi:hypothetical protein SBF1_920001 [Candidatus Desulfosporosinus infrequens]|uniref:Uncharacterized protein n=1 Tax=Candidatus Desulfosporosinus infrequens TaxID=2043169 RepID=A0A2U3LX12_9FIRM|nr:hypothetical protein SBF1_920001 [Candidatus Desulfosporosinus infrequens]
MEISFALRKKIFQDLECRTRFIDTIRSLIKTRYSHSNTAYHLQK